MSDWEGRAGASRGTLWVVLGVEGSMRVFNGGNVGLYRLGHVGIVSKPSHNGKLSLI